MSTKTQILDAAIRLVGTSGLRSLTHARVDDAAGLPKGSTSNHFRTRKALLVGVGSRLVDLDSPATGAPFEPASVEELIDALCAIFDRISGEQRAATTARLVLFLEGNHDPEVRELMTQGRRVLENVFTVAFARLGAPHPQTATAAMAACFEGLLLHRIARHDQSDPRPVFELVVRAALAPGGPPVPAADSPGPSE